MAGGNSPRTETLGARMWYPFMLSCFGRHDEAQREAQLLIEIDPLSASAGVVLGQVLYMARRHDESLAILRKTVDLDPNHPTVLGFMAFNHLALGEFGEAVALMEKAHSVNQHSYWLAMKGWFYGRVGRKEDALRVLREVEDMAKHTFVSAQSFAFVYAGIPDMDSWRATVPLMLEERIGLLPAHRAPWYDHLRSDPAFQEIIRKVALPS